MKMASSEKIPIALKEKVAAISVLVDTFCDLHLNTEYQELIHKAMGVLARKRPSPLLKGKENSWAAGLINAIGWANYLSDPSQVPHCKVSAIYEYFEISSSAGTSKSSEIKKSLNIDQWTIHIQPEGAGLRT
jgi:Domain of unknown function (DUF6398)